jgi:hypothetical protein
MNRSAQKRFEKRFQKVWLDVDYSARPSLTLKWRSNADGLVFWVQDWVVNADTGKTGVLTGALWFVSPDYSTEGLIRQMYRAVEAFEIHEMREFFKYKGRKVFNPHKRNIA